MPMSMMVQMGISLRYISIAAPDCNEWVPTLWGSKPRRALPYELQADCRCKDIFGGYVFHATFYPNCTHRCIQWSAWICPDSIHKRAHWRTGRMTVSCFKSFVCISNVIATLSAESKSLDCASMSSPSLKKRTFLRHMSFMRFCSCLGTLGYSQDRLQAKKAAPMVS